MAGAHGPSTDNRGIKLLTLRPFMNGEARWQPGSRLPWYAAILAGISIFGLAQGFAFAAARVIKMTGRPAPVPPHDRFETAATLMLVLLVSQIAIVALTIAAASIRERPAAALRLQPPEEGRSAYLFSLFAMIPAVIAINVLAYVINPHDPLVDLRQFLEIARAANPLVPALAVCLGAPLSEELLFRGFLLAPLASTRLGYWPAAVLVSLAWTLLHWGYTWAGLAEVFAIGLFLSWTLRRTGSLRVPIACHAIYNTCLFVGLRYWPL